MSMDPQEHEVLDPQLLETLRALQDPSDPDLAHELITLFLRDSAARVAAIRIAAVSGDLAAQAEIAELAHQLKGSAGALSASRFRETASDLEMATRHGRPDAAKLASLCARLAEAFDEVRAALARLGFP
jgi:HPt (histidine-containing phosphotransfer) domain-containing protein